MNSPLHLKHVIALDVGGSSVKSALVAGNGDIPLPPVFTAIDSQGSADAILDALAGIVNRHRADAAKLDVIGIGIGFPGPFNYTTGVSLIQGVAKYEAVYGLNIGEALQNRLSLPRRPIRFRNDAEAAIVGEASYGAGKPYRRLIGITLGTGFGSTFIKNGRSVTNGAGVPSNSWLYSVPILDIQADDVFSTRGLMARLHRAGINASTVADAVKQAGAAAVIAQFGADLGRFLHPFVTDFLAETVLVLGGIANTYPLMADSLNQALPVSALPGQLGVSAPLLGAAELFFDQGLK